VTLPAQSSGRRRQTALALRTFTPPEQAELQAISNALDAALGYSPLRSAPANADDTFALVTRRIEQRFWDEVFVDRPEMRRILFELDKGQIVVITGERGTGKTTAIHAAVRELGVSENPASRTHLTYIFDANTYAADLNSEAAATRTIHREIYASLEEQALSGRPDRKDQWRAYLYRKSQAFEALRMAVDQHQLAPHDPTDWRTIAEMPECEELVRGGYVAFATETPSERLRHLLAFLHDATDCEILLVIDNLDHLSDAVQCRCARELFTVLTSSPERIRGAIAVRPENFDRIQGQLHTAARPPKVEIARRDLTKPTAELMMAFISRRLALVNNSEVLPHVLGSIPQDKLVTLAEETGPQGAQDPATYLAVLQRVLEYVVYDVFSTEHADTQGLHDEQSFVRYIHQWHNGSLRECARSVVKFVEDILQNATHMYRLADLMRAVVESDHEPEHTRRAGLRRLTRSMLYRHLLFWGTHDNDNLPLNVMLFDAEEEDTDPPLHFLRLRLLQYLAHREPRYPRVSRIQEDFLRLGVRPERVSEELRQLAAPRTEDDTGLLRIDNAPPDHDTPLPPDSTVTLLDAGRFLVTELCMSTEYLFWSAVTPRMRLKQEKMPTPVEPRDVQRDAFRSKVATGFLERDVVSRLEDEHPYLGGPVGERWTVDAARKRLLLYQRLFGFRRRAWFLNQCCNVLYGFIPKSQDPEWQDARESIARVRRFTEAIDKISDPSAGSPK
jgi:energy-coupling factor transporter ATP-binding protein EcfA2